MKAVGLGLLLGALVLVGVVILSMGEDRFLLGYDGRADDFFESRSAVVGRFAEGGTKALISDGAEVVCLDSVYPQQALNALMRSPFATRYDVRPHRAPANDSSLTVFLGYPDGTSQVFYLPLGSRERDLAEREIGSREGERCFHAGQADPSGS